MYLVEGRVSSLAKVFAVLAILITILGVFGLASYTAEQRTKEIGIRKVLGASERQVVSLFLNVFLKIIGIACLAAIPMAWFAAYKWLQGFAYRIHMSWWMFALSGIIALLIALVPVSYQSVKAALMNPVKSLRSE